MIRFGRLAGAILLDYEGECYLIGHTKHPCDFGSFGFEAVDKDRDQAIKIERLTRKSDSSIRWEESSVIFTLENVSCEDSLTKLSDIFLIRRNNMVSERIWGLLIEELDDHQEALSGQWIIESPGVIWDIVRDAVLRC